MNYPVVKVITKTQLGGTIKKPYCPLMKENVKSDKTIHG